MEVDYWALCDEALDDEILFEGDFRRGADDDEDQFGNLLRVTSQIDAASSIARLPCGDIHVCEGTDCDYAEVQQSGDRLCTLTGRVLARDPEIRTDHSTGRSTYSVDPDLNGGGGYGGGWAKKICAVRASNSAFRDSFLMDDSLMPATAPQKKKKALIIKRGALCVDEVVHVEPSKRARSSKKDTSSCSTRSLLQNEALEILQRLIASGASKAVASTTRTRSKRAQPIDARLKNRDNLFQSALRRYLRAATETGLLPCLDDVHNLRFAVDRVVTAASSSAVRGGCGRTKSTQFKATAARLVVALWSGACMTPYLSKARRGADSFRPFAAGAFYAFKRGLVLGDGTVLMPRCDDFSNKMPAAKSINNNSSLKSLHASSHRGLCTLHRAISSVPEKQAARFFNEAIGVARELEELTCGDL